MKLYHITLEVGENKKIFNPREIITPRDDEDTTQARICLSDSIENCLNLVAWAEGDKISDIFTGYSDYEKSIPIRVYEFEVDSKDENLVHPHQVHKSGVIDAGEFNEYWYINNSIAPTCSYVVCLDEYKTRLEIIRAAINDEGYTEDELEKYLNDNPEANEDDFYESFYDFEKDVNFDISYTKCDVLKPSQYSFERAYQVFNLKVDSNKEVRENDILEIFEEMTCCFHNDTFDMYFDVSRYNENEFSIGVDTVFFGIIKDDLISLLEKKDAKLA